MRLGGRVCHKSINRSLGSMGAILKRSRKTMTAFFWFRNLWDARFPFGFCRDGRALAHRRAQRLRERSRLREKHERGKLRGRFFRIACEARQSLRKRDGLSQETMEVFATRGARKS